MFSDHRIHQLDNGLRIATVAMPHMASVSVGLWNGVGSRNERPREHGLAHFLEHMLFKGTPSRNAEDISRQLEGLGSSIDGFTVEDHTSYQAKAPAERFRPLFEILSDFYRNPVLDPAELEFEKQVIHEEIAMIRDQPSQFLEDLASEAAWGKDHPLGRSITGTSDSLDSFQRGDVLRFFRNACCAVNTVVSVAGNIDHDEVFDAVEAELGDLPGGTEIPYEPAPTEFGSHRFEEEGEYEQAHLALSFRGVDRHDPGRYAFKLLNVILGECMSSRLFQEIRERRGLCYEIQSDVVSFSDAGLLQVFLALSPRYLEEALLVMGDVFDDLRINGVTEEELAAAKSYVVGQSRVGLENTASQMMWAGECLLFFDRWLDPDEVHRRIEGVTQAELLAAANRYLDPGALSSALIGPLTSRSVLDRWIEAVGG